MLYIFKVYWQFNEILVTHKTPCLKFSILSDKLGTKLFANFCDLEFGLIRNLALLSGFLTMQKQKKIPTTIF